MANVFYSSHLGFTAELFTVVLLKRFYTMACSVKAISNVQLCPTLQGA
jgi:hypothetical protein